MTDPPAPELRGIHGKIEQFNPASENITAHVQRVRLYLDVNGIAEAKQVSTFLMLMGAQNYNLVRRLLTLDELISVMEAHFNPKKLVIAERFHFYQRKQKSGETIAEFLADLRHLSIKCEFGTFLNEALRDRLVCGLRSEAIQRRLLTETALTLDRAVELSQGMEAADRNTKGLNKGASLPSPTGESTVLRVGSQKCSRCDKTEHEAKDCRFREYKCHKCGKTGHLAAACRSTRHNPRRHPP